MVTDISSAFASLTNAKLIALSADKSLSDERMASQLILNQVNAMRSAYTDATGRLTNGYHQIRAAQTAETAAMTTLTTANTALAAELKSYNSALADKNSAIAALDAAIKNMAAAKAAAQSGPLLTALSAAQSKYDIAFKNYNDVFSEQTAAANQKSSSSIDLKNAQYIVDDATAELNAANSAVDNQRKSGAWFGPDGINTQLINLSASRVTAAKAALAEANAKLNAAQAEDKKSDDDLSAVKAKEGNLNADFAAASIALGKAAIAYKISSEKANADANSIALEKSIAAKTTADKSLLDMETAYRAESVKYNAAKTTVENAQLAFDSKHAATAKLLATPAYQKDTIVKNDFEALQSKLSASVDKVAAANAAVKTANDEVSTAQSNYDGLVAAEKSKLASLKSDAQAAETKAEAAQKAAEAAAAQTALDVANAKKQAAASTASAASAATSEGNAQKSATLAASQERMAAGYAQASGDHETAAETHALGAQKSVGDAQDARTGAETALAEVTALESSVKSNAASAVASKMAAAKSATDSAKSATDAQALVDKFSSRTVSPSNTGKHAATLNANDAKLLDLPDADPINGSEHVYAVQGGLDKKLSLSVLQNSIGSIVIRSEADWIANTSMISPGSRELLNNQAYQIVGGVNRSFRLSANGSNLIFGVNPAVDIDRYLGNVGQYRMPSDVTHSLSLVNLQVEVPNVLTPWVSADAVSGGLSIDNVQVLASILGTLGGDQIIFRNSTFGEGDGDPVKTGFTIPAHSGSAFIVENCRAEFDLGSAAKMFNFTNSHVDLVRVQNNNFLTDAGMKIVDGILTADSGVVSGNDFGLATLPMGNVSPQSDPWHFYGNRGNVAESSVIGSLHWNGNTATTSVTDGVYGELNITPSSVIGGSDTERFSIDSAATGRLKCQANFETRGRVYVDLHTENSGVTEANYRVSVSKNTVTPGASDFYMPLSLKDVGDQVSFSFPVTLSLGETIDIRIAGDGSGENLVFPTGQLLFMKY